MAEEEEDGLQSHNRGPSLPSPLGRPPGFLYDTAGWHARIDRLLAIAFLAVSVAAVWRLVTRSLVTDEIPLYVGALLIPIYWGAVKVAKSRLKRRGVKDDDGS